MGASSTTNQRFGLSLLFTLSQKAKRYDRSIKLRDLEGRKPESETLLCNGLGNRRERLADVVVEFGGKEILRVPLKGPNLTIGRDAEVDVHLDNRALSRKHAQIEKRGAAIWIRDLASQNGTYVNGKRIDAPQALQQDDIIELGRYRLTIEGAQEAGEETPVLTLIGPEEKHRFAMVGDEIIIGRAPSCDIAIGHRSISRRHLRVALDGDGFIAEDLGSQNGTRLHGKKLVGPTPFEAGDQLHMSEFSIELGFLSNDESNDGEKANKTMMIDRSELAKAAYVGGDFERMDSQAGGLAIGRQEEGTDVHHDENTGEHSLAKPPREEKRIKPAMRPKAKPARAKARLAITHPDEGDHEFKLRESVLVIGEDGRKGDVDHGRSYSDQAYLVISKSDDGHICCVVGDRRLVTVNGRPLLFSPLEDGDMIELGLLTAVFHT